MQNRRIGIIGTGSYVPNKILTNKELSQLVDTTPEWIEEKVGVKERRIADYTQSTSDLALYASHEALRDCGLNPSNIDLIVLATSSPDMIQPSTASILQGKLGAYGAAAFDVSAVCAGFIYALVVAESLMRTNRQYRRALVIGAETYSKILDWDDRSTCVFFGDGAGAVVLGDVPFGRGVQKHFIENDGRGWDVIMFDNDKNKFAMQGKQVWDFATKQCPRAIREVLEIGKIPHEEIDKIILHQANINIIKSCMDELNLPMGRTFTNLDKYGNTSGASIPIAIAEADRAGFFNKGDKVILSGFGGGLSVGAIKLIWDKEAL